jgi:hypothetical protein
MARLICLDESPYRGKSFADLFIPHLKGVHHPVPQSDLYMQVFIGGFGLVTFLTDVGLESDGRILAFCHPYRTRSDHSRPFWGLQLSRQCIPSDVRGKLVVHRIQNCRQGI